MNRVGEQVRRGFVTDRRRVAAQQTCQPFREILRSAEAGLAGIRFEQRSHPRYKRGAKVEQPAQSQAGEGHLGLKDACAAELVQPTAELVEQTDETLRSQPVEVEQLF